MMEAESFVTGMAGASPSFSSYSSSDLDTESTGSFFYDRSITLGNLMGLKSDTAAGATVVLGGRAESNRSNNNGAGIGGPRTRTGSRRRRKCCWWRLCRNRHDLDCRAAHERPSLEQFLQEERRSMSTVSLNPGSDSESVQDYFVYDDFGALGVTRSNSNSNSNNNGNGLFWEGRVVPPQTLHPRYVQSNRRIAAAAAAAAGRPSCDCRSSSSSSCCCFALECFSGRRRSVFLH